MNPLAIKHFLQILILINLKRILLNLICFFEDFWKYDVSFSLNKRGVLGIIGEEATIKTWEKLFLGELIFVGCIKIDGIRYERINIFECKAGFLPLGIGNLFPDNSSILDNFLAKFMNFENKIFIRQSYINNIKDFFKKKWNFVAKRKYIEFFIPNLWHFLEEL